MASSLSFLVLPLSAQEAPAGSLLASGIVSERVSSDRIPDLLSGIWQGSDRLLLFGRDGNEFALVLREFYGLYADRAVEPVRYAELSTRPRNDATAKNAEKISVRYVTIAENVSHTAGAYELEIAYPAPTKSGFETVVVPVCVIDEKLYLDFLVRGSAEYTDSQLTLSGTDSAVGEENAGVEIPAQEGFWRDCGAAGGIQVSPPVIAEELTGYYVADGAFYHIRYWKTEMPYKYDKAGFTDGEKNYTVDKYMRVAGNVYTCATGRRTQIRNIEKSASLPSPHVFDRDNVICALGMPYLERIESADSREGLQAIVDENNARCAPLPKPLFPPVQSTVRWPDIESLDLYNPSTWNRRNLDVGK